MDKQYNNAQKLIYATARHLRFTDPEEHALRPAGSCIASRVGGLMELRSRVRTYAGLDENAEDHEIISKVEDLAMFRASVIEALCLNDCVQDSSAIEVVKGLVAGPSEPEQNAVQALEDQVEEMRAQLHNAKRRLKRLAIANNIQGRELAEALGARTFECER